MRRLFTYSYIIAKRAKEMQKELLKKENILIPTIVVLQKIISNEKLVITILI